MSERWFTAEQCEARERVWRAHCDNEGLTLTPEEVSALWLSLLQTNIRLGRLRDEVEAFQSYDDEREGS
jgi:hypothetical protein